MKRIATILLYLGFTVILHGQENNMVDTNSQVFAGKVYDNKTGLPVANVNVYFNGSSYFTTTNESGEFYLKVPKRINMQLVISQVAYETLVIDDPFRKDLKKILLNEKEYELSEVVIKPGRFSRQELMEAFEKQFLGEDKAGKSCIIKNKEDIQLRYDEGEKTLSATNEQPVIIENNYLGYKVNCLIADFQVRYKNNKSLNTRNIDKILLRANMFFEDIAPNNLIIEKRREETYKSSLVYFFKNLANGTLKSSKHCIYNYGCTFPADPDQYFNITDNGLQKIVRIKPNTDISKPAAYMSQFQYPILGIIFVTDPTGGSSNITFLTDEFTIDSFGLIDKKDYVSISGQMGKQRAGSQLPLNYELPSIIQKQGDIKDIPDKLNSLFQKQLKIFPQEKIYLQTDKPYYITGEKIFFRAFVPDAFSNRQDTFSRYVYVELINPADSVAQRVKIRRDSTGLFYGAIPLPEDLPQGAYRIRAYTQYMQNQGESSFFSKQVKISDPQVLKVQTQTDFQFPEDGKINASLRFIDAKTQAPIQLQSVLLKLNQDQSFTRKRDKDGWIRVKLTVSPDALKRVLYVEFTNDRNIFKQFIPIPYPEGDFDVSFYPEGGQLIAGQSSNVAFKAVDTHGTGIDVTGEVRDSKGNSVAQLKTVHDGMGEFFINPLPDEHYHAEIQVKGEREEVKGTGLRVKEISLPEVETNALALKVMNRNDKLLISINKPDSILYPELYVLIHSRGSVVYAKAWDSSKDFVILDQSIFPSGVSHIILLTKDFRIVSERLIFILNDDNGTAAFQTQKAGYQKREQVEAKIQLTDEKQQPLVAGNFSIAITNDKEVVPDTTLSILSSILLSSELRGHIDNPAYYFQKGNKDAERAADLLMRTQGWTRYAISDVVRGKISYPKIPFEQSQEITGSVKSGFILKDAKNFKVSLLSLNHSFFDLTETDKNGRYVFRNFEFPDSTGYVIQALNKRGGGGEVTNLYVDEDTFPKIHLPWIEPISKEEKKEPIFMDYVAKADLQYTYEKGRRLVHLPEVEVKGTYTDKEQDRYKSLLYSEPDYSFSENEITKYGTTDIKSLLYRVPGVMVVRNDIRIKMASGSPLLIIDDIPYQSTEGKALEAKKARNEKIDSFQPAKGESIMDILNTININDIGKIDFLTNTSNTSMYGMRGGNGVIVIYTKRGNGEQLPLPSFNIKSVMPLGYQLPIEFYSPKYDTQEKIDGSKSDLRTTIYWKPNVMTNNEGDAKLDFYTADDPGTYSVVIEGVSENGKLIYYRGKAAITVNSDK